MQIGQRLFGDDIELAGLDRSGLAVEREQVALVKPAAEQAAPGTVYLVNRYRDAGENLCQ